MVLNILVIFNLDLFGEMSGVKALTRLGIRGPGSAGQLVTGGGGGGSAVVAVSSSAMPASAGFVASTVGWSGSGQRPGRSALGFSVTETSSSDWTRLGRGSHQDLYQLTRYRRSPHINERVLEHQSLTSWKRKVPVRTTTNSL